MERNIEFLQNSLVKAGFGPIYNEQIKADIAAGKAVVELPYTEHALNEKDYVLFRPKVVEKEDRPGFYIFPEMDAMLYKSDKLVAAISVPHYKMTGMTAVQAANVLTGGVVLNTQGEDSDKKVKYYFSAIDFTKPVNEGQKHELVRLPAKEHDLTRLLSNERHTARPEEKDLILDKLQNGLKADTSVWSKELGRSSRVVLQLAIVENKLDGKYDLSMKVWDREGILLREHIQKPEAKMEVRNDIKLHTSKKQEEMSKETLNLLSVAGRKYENKSKGHRV
jgi:hypothetical protein